jgi:hypothetical protein
MRDRAFLCDEVERIWQEGFSLSARIVEMEEGGTARDESEKLVREQILTEPERFRQRLMDFRTILLGAATTGRSNMTFGISPQPVFHKNFNMLTRELLRYQQEGSEAIFCDKEACEALGVEIISRPVATVENGYVRHNPGHLARELMSLHAERTIRVVGATTRQESRYQREK